MKTLAQKPTALELRRAAQPTAASTANGHLLLRQSGDGWSLITPRGELVFRGYGLDARRRCLEVAFSRGASAVLS